MAVVNGERQLAELGARLQGAAAAGIRKSTQAQIRAAVKPLIPIIQESARTSLPKAGGMNNFVARRRPRTSVRVGPRIQQVRITYKGKGAPSDKGPWRHPVFAKGADRTAWTWVSQTYQPATGWWERAEAEGTPFAKVLMSQVLRDVAAEVNRLGL